MSNAVASLPTAAITADPAILAIARVAHETTCSYLRATGDFSLLLWEQASPDEQKKAIDWVTLYVNHPDADVSVDGDPMVLLDQKTRIARSVFHGVVRAIAREQSRT